MSAICTMVEKKLKKKGRQESFNDRVRQEAQLEVSRQKETINKYVSKLLDSLSTGTRSPQKEEQPGHSAY